MIKNIFRKGEDSNEEIVASEGIGKKGTIMVVDDSPTEIHVFKKFLEKQGYRIIEAKDGQEGIEKAIQAHPDLILMDVVMPVLNGFQATRQLKNNEKTADIPVIMITTKDQKTDINWGMRQGADEYMVKPVAPAELLSKIRALLNE